MKIVKVKNPKGYFLTKISFSNKELAEHYVNTLKNQFLLKKAELLEHQLSKAKQKLVKFAKQEKYLLTEQGSKLLLWQEE